MSDYNNDMKTEQESEESATDSKEGFFSPERRRKRKENGRKLRHDMAENIRNSTPAERFINIVKVLLLLFIVIGVPLIMYFCYRDTFFNMKAIRHLPTTMKDNKLSAMLMLLFAQLLQIIICILPGQPIQVASSYLFGFWGGLLLTLVGAVIGTALTYFLADFLGKSAMHLLFGKERVNDYIKRLNSNRAYYIIFLIYLIPGVPKDLVSYVAGISDIRLKPFLMLSTVGRIPGVMGSLLIGKFTSTHNYAGIAIVGVLSLIIFIFCVKRKDRLMQWIDEFEEKEEFKESERRARALRIASKLGFSKKHDTTNNTVKENREDNVQEKENRENQCDA